MDDFEKDYFAKLKQLADDYDPVRRDLAKSRVKMFAAALTRQLIEENEKFDLILFAGNSGLYLSYLTAQVYKKLNINYPPVIILPIYRFKKVQGELKINDNSYLQS